MMLAWMRLLYVTFTSEKYKKSLTFGREKHPLSIKIEGQKYLSSLKDTFTIEIENLTYNEVVNLIDGKYYNVEIYSGYRDGGAKRIFDGGVTYISNRRNDPKNNTVIVICSSKLIAKYGQSRLNLSMSSGINMYNALSFAAKRAGIQNANISDTLRYKYFNDNQNVDGSFQSYLNQVVNDNSTFISNADSSVDGSTIVSIFDAAKSNGKIYKIDNSRISLRGGYPRLTTDGIVLSIQPTFDLVCGDSIKIDNSILDISVSSVSDISKNLGKYFDEQSVYLIYQIDFNLSNRDSDFTMTIYAKPRTLYQNLLRG